MQNMPVDDDIHILVCRILHAAIDDILQILGVAALAISAVLCGIHSQTHDIDIPLLSELAEGILINKAREPCNTVCADAAKLNRIAVLVHKL